MKRSSLQNRVSKFMSKSLMRLTPVLPCVSVNPPA